MVENFVLYSSASAASVKFSIGVPGSPLSFSCTMVKGEEDAGNQSEQTEGGGGEWCVKPPLPVTSSSNSF